MTQPLAEARLAHNSHNGHQRGEAMRASEGGEMSWTVASAKAKLSEVMDRAQLAPQTITRDGRPRVVVVSAKEWQRKITRR